MTGVKTSGVDSRWTCERLNNTPNPSPLGQAGLGGPALWARGGFTHLPALDPETLPRCGEVPVPATWARRGLEPARPLLTWPGTAGRCSGTPPRRRVSSIMIAHTASQEEPRGQQLARVTSWYPRDSTSQVGLRLFHEQPHRTCQGKGQCLEKGAGQLSQQGCCSRRGPPETLRQCFQE